MSAHQDLIEKISNRLKDWDYQLDRLEHRISDLTGDAKQAARQRLEEARTHRQELRQKLDQAKGEAEQTLDSVRDNLESGFNNLKSRINSMRDDLFGRDDKE